MFLMSCVVDVVDLSKHAIKTIDRLISDKNLQYSYREIYLGNDRLKLS